MTQSTSIPHAFRCCILPQSYTNFCFLFSLYFEMPLLAFPRALAWFTEGMRLKLWGMEAGLEMWKQVKVYIFTWIKNRCSDNKKSRENFPTQEHPTTFRALPSESILQSLAHSSSFFALGTEIKFTLCSAHNDWLIQVGCNSLQEHTTAMPVSQ